MASLLQSWQKTAASGDGLAEASLSSLRSEGRSPTTGSCWTPRRRQASSWSPAPSTTPLAG
ncbi:unnamed protein product [Prorocentrum cordatum]|nr:unnamed protein product [Polarella glacialis]